MRLPVIKNSLNPTVEWQLAQLLLTVARGFVALSQSLNASEVESAWPESSHSA